MFRVTTPESRPRTPPEYFIQRNRGIGVDSPVMSFSRSLSMNGWLQNIIRASEGTVSEENKIELNELGGKCPDVKPFSDDIRNKINCIRNACLSDSINPPAINRMAREVLPLIPNVSSPLARFRAMQ